MKRPLLALYRKGQQSRWASVRAGSEGLARLWNEGVNLVLRVVDWHSARRLDERLARLLESGPAIAASASLGGEQRAARVLFVIGSLGPGGSERQLVNTALGLAQGTSFAPIIACLDLSTPAKAFYKSIAERGGVRVIDLSIPNASLGRSAYPDRITAFPRGLRSDVASLWALCDQLKPDIVHAFLDDTNVKAGLAGLLARVPRVVLSLRSVAPDNFGFHQPYMRPAYRALLRHEHVSVCSNSQAGADDYRRWLEMPELAINVIANGIDLETFGRGREGRLAPRYRDAVPEKGLLIGAVMRLTEEKDPLLWARAMVQIARQRAHVHFLLAGEGPLRPALEAIIARSGYGERFHLLGHVREVVPILQSLDILVLTSRKEGLPNILIEAQAMGIAVVTTPAGGAPEALLPERTGIVASAATADAVALACLRLVDDAALRRRLAQAGPAFVRQHFPIDQMLQRTVAHYERGLPYVRLDEPSRLATSAPSTTDIASSRAR